MAQDTIRRKYLKELHDYTKRDTIMISSGFSISFKSQNIPDYLFSITNEDIHGMMSAMHGLKGDELDLIIHSPGGIPEAAEQIVNYLRKKYDHIRAIIPQNAMSAATMIACACDEIIMGKHSAIGPIDPQIKINTLKGQYTAPAQSILDEFNLAKAEMLKDPKTAPLWVRKIDGYPIGFLKVCENVINLSKNIVSLWLENWMLKDEPKKKKLSTSISNWLGDTNLHKIHSRPIDINQAKSKGLKVKPLEEDNKLQDKILSVFHSSMATHTFTNCTKFIENHNGKGAYIVVEIKPMPSNP